VWGRVCVRGNSAERTSVQCSRHVSTAREKVMQGTGKGVGVVAKKVCVVKGREGVNVVCRGGAWYGMCSGGRCGKRCNAAYSGVASSGRQR